MLGNTNSHIRRSPSPKPTFAGLRRYNRRELDFGVYLQDEDGWEIPVDGLNISPTGVFVASNFLFEVGDQHTLIIELPSGEMFRMKARVARVEAPVDDEFDTDAVEASGMGYEFVETAEQDWSQLCSIVAGS
ncbi:MAG: PilZ domain-containing protein [Myxococcota bacterium]